MLEKLRYVPAILAALVMLWLFLRIIGDFFHRGFHYDVWLREPQRAKAHGMRVGACLLSFVGTGVLLAPEGWRSLVYAIPLAILVGWGAAWSIDYPLQRLRNRPSPPHPHLPKDAPDEDEPR